MTRHTPASLAALRAEVETALRALAIYGIGPSVKTWNRDKPAHLPTQSGICKAIDCTWRNLLIGAGLRASERDGPKIDLELEGPPLEPVRVDYDGALPVARVRQVTRRERDGEGNVTVRLVAEIMELR